MQLGDRVRTTVALPSIPAGAVGVVEEVGRLFIVARFEDGRIGFYARRQLHRLRLGCSESASTNAPTDLGFTSTSVPAGSHLFLAAGTESGARAVASDYLIAGIRAGETCICCANRSWRRALGSALAPDGLTGGGGSKTLIFVDPAEAYLDASEFTAERQLARLGAAMDAVGGTRLRIFGRIGGDTLRSLPEGEWWEYEMRVTHLAQERGITTMCAYAASDRSYSGYAQALHPYVVSKGQVIAHKTPL